MIMPQESGPTGKSRAGYHRLEDLMVCPRKFGYREIEHLVPLVMPKALALGTCVHEALAAFYRGMDPLAALRNVPYRAAYRVPDAKPMIEAYIKQRGRERVKVLFVEEEFEIKLRGRTFTRRIDLGVCDFGRIFVWDHKTSGDIAKRKSTFPFDAALFTQWIVGKAVLPAKYQLPWGGVMVNLISTRKPHESRCHNVTWMPRLIEEAPKEMAYWAERADAWVARGVSGWKLPKSWRCQGQYGQCDYLPLCLRGDVELGAFVRE
jgi:hypothetical protein